MGKSFIASWMTTMNTQIVKHLINHRTPTKMRHCMSTSEKIPVVNQGLIQLRWSLLGLIQITTIINIGIDEIKPRCTFSFLPSLTQLRKSLILFSLQIQEELDSTKSEISKNMFPLKKGQKYLTHLPQKGMQADKLIEIVKKDYKGLGMFICRNIVG